MYFRLFNTITSALRETDIDKVKEILKNAQIETEDMYINCEVAEKVYPLFETKNETD